MLQHFVDLKDLQTVTDPMVILEKIESFILPIIIISLINLLFTTILQYYILFNPIDKDNTIVRSIIKSLKYFIPFLIIMILLAFAGSIAMVIGFFALVIGIFFSALYIVALYLFILPVMMVEETNIADTISRSFRLLHRNFWANIGWVAVLLIIMIITSIILSSIILLPFTGNFIKSIFNPEQAKNMVDIATNPIFIVLSACINALILPVMPIFAGILYFNGKAGEDQTQEITETEPYNSTPRIEDLYAKPYSDDHPDNPDRIV